VDNWRWAGVPFYLRTGKRLARRATEIAIQFKCAPSRLFSDTRIGRTEPNWLILQIQPDEGISLEFSAKVPGPTIQNGAVTMDFDYEDWFGAEPSTGYETLLYDAFIGDQTLFQRADTVEAGWRVTQPILDVWSALPPENFPNYEPGSWGPQAANDLLARTGHSWRDYVDVKGRMTKAGAK
jgi:glucose-6-phosphate 1-dehydrogenase